MESKHSSICLLKGSLLIFLIALGIMAMHVPLVKSIVDEGDRSLRGSQRVSAKIGMQKVKEYRAYDIDRYLYAFSKECFVWNCRPHQTQRFHPRTEARRDKRGSASDRLY